MDTSCNMALFVFFIAATMTTGMSFATDDDDENFFEDVGFRRGDYFNNRKFQNWLGKRGFPSDRTAFTFGSGLGDNRELLNWRQFLGASFGPVSKRQLGFGPRSFGNVHSLFTNGLQDWRKTFNGAVRKREAPTGQEPEMQAEAKPEAEAAPLPREEAV